MADGTRKLCECGCGEPTSLATKTDSSTNRIKGQPMRFVNGHSRRGKPKNGRLCFSKSQQRWIIWCRDNTPMLYARGVMAAQIGRLLRPDELVHHEDEDTTNDDPSNLEITTRRGHIEMHRMALRAARDAKRAA